MREIVAEMIIMPRIAAHREETLGAHLVAVKMATLGVWTTKNAVTKRDIPKHHVQMGSNHLIFVLTIIVFLKNVLVVIIWSVVPNHNMVLEYLVMANMSAVKPIHPEPAKKTVIPKPEIARLCPILTKPVRMTVVIMINAFATAGCNLAYLPYKASEKVAAGSTKAVATLAPNILIPQFLMVMFLPENVIVATAKDIKLN